MQEHPSSADVGLKGGEKVHKFIWVHRSKIWNIASGLCFSHTRLNFLLRFLSSTHGPGVVCVSGSWFPSFGSRGQGIKGRPFVISCTSKTDKVKSNLHLFGALGLRQIHVIVHRLHSLDSSVREMSALLRPSAPKLCNSRVLIVSWTRWAKKGTSVI